MNDKLKLIVVSGPTAIGKTELSIQLAKELECDIISADSRQIYREMDIGTAKPSPQELAAVRHHFINYKSIHDYYSAGRFEVDTLELLKRYQKDIVLLTGGSGLYIQAVCIGIDEFPSPDPGLRNMLQSRLDDEGLNPLVEELKRLDHETSLAIDLNNPKRVLRALEIIHQTGKKYSELKSQTKKSRDFDMLNIGLDMPREDLFERINLRVDRMLESGLLQEVRSLMPYRDLTALQTVGYTEFFGYFDGKYDLDEAIRLCKRNTRRYAKRQLTWFRKDESIHWFTPDSYKQIIEMIHGFTASK
jgi:tRNA dimethylallyltransferase